SEALFEDDVRSGAFGDASLCGFAYSGTLIRGQGEGAVQSLREAVGVFPVEEEACGTIVAYHFNLTAGGGSHDDLTEGEGFHAGVGVVFPDAGNDDDRGFADF